MKKQWLMWFKRLVVVALIAAAVPVACVSASGDSIKQNQNGTPMKYEVLLKDGHSNYDDMTTMKISSSEVLQTVFARINSTRKPGFEMPEVDFTVSDLFFFTGGNLSTGGHSYNVLEVLLFKDKVEVRLEANSPGPGEYATTVISSPFILVKFAKTDLPVELVFVPKH